MTRPAPAATSLLELLTTGIAQAVADADIGFSWRDTDGDVPQYIQTRPAEVDQLVSWTPIPTSADPVYTVATVDLQAWYRGERDGDVRDVWAMRDRIRYYLSGRFPWRLPTGLHVSILTFGYGASLGLDESNRWSFSDLWHLTVTESRH